MEALLMFMLWFLAVLVVIIGVMAMVLSVSIIIALIKDIFR